MSERDLVDIGRAERLVADVLQRHGPVLTPPHPGVQVAAWRSSRPSSRRLAEKTMVGDAEDAHRTVQFLGAELREGWPGALEVLELGGNDLAQFAAGAGEHGDRGAQVDEFGDSSSGDDRLVIGMRMDEQHSLRSPGKLFLHTGQTRRDAPFGWRYAFCFLTRDVDRARALASNSTLRMRMRSGVTSTHSSSRANSRHSSSVRMRGRRHPLEHVGGRLAHVGELLFLGDVDVHVVGARVLTDDHAFVHLLRRLDEERHALLQRDDRERRDHAGAVGDDRPVVAGDDGSRPRVVAVGDRVGDAGAAGDR